MIIDRLVKSLLHNKVHYLFYRIAGNFQGQLISLFSRITLQPRKLFPRNIITV